MSDRNERNQVFQPAITGDTQLDIPVESVPLPSCGLVYPPNSPLYGAETIDIRAMTAKEEDILTSKALIKKGTVITQLLQSCIVDKGIDVRSLLGGDRNAIMIALRITGYGPEYTVEMQCPACRQTAKSTFDLASLPIKTLELSPAVVGENVFEVKLPVRKSTIKFKFLTGADEEEIVAVQEKKRKIFGPNAIDNLITTKLKACIVSVDGNTDRANIDRYVSTMPARDSHFLRKYIDSNEPGVEMKVTYSCENIDCGVAQEVALPLGPSFFWPE